MFISAYVEASSLRGGAARRPAEGEDERGDDLFVGGQSGFLEREVGGEQRVDRRLELRCAPPASRAAPRADGLSPGPAGDATTFFEQVEQFPLDAD
jgi:hypothetical protein